MDSIRPIRMPLQASRESGIESYHEYHEMNRDMCLCASSVNEISILQSKAPRSTSPRRQRPSARRCGEV